VCGVGSASLHHEEGGEVLAEEEARGHEVEPRNVNSAQQLVERPQNPTAASALLGFDPDCFWQLWVSQELRHAIHVLVAFVERHRCRPNPLSDALVEHLLHIRQNISEPRCGLVDCSLLGFFVLESLKLFLHFPPLIKSIVLHFHFLFLVLLKFVRTTSGDLEADSLESFHGKQVL